MQKIKSCLLFLLCVPVVANASTANLWYNLHTGKSRSFASAAAACRYIGTVPGRELGKNRGKCWKDGENGFPGFEMSEYWAEPKTCDLKHIEGTGSKGTHQLEFPGTDKVPTMMRQCNNNCEVEYTRVKKEGAAAGSDYGGVVCNEIAGKDYCVSDYTALQTGTVCNPKPGESNETTKYDEVNDDAAGDDSGKDSGGDDGSGKPDGGGKGDPSNQGKTPKQDGHDDGKNNGGAGGGDAGGNQSGGQGGAGKDSEGDSGAADDKDKIDDKKPKPGGGGGGGGGGSPGQSGHDGKDGADGKDGGGSGGGKPDGGNGKPGEGGTPGGKDDGKGGNPGGGTGGEGSSPDGDGKHDGKHDEGEGSGISGGDCKTGRAPVCKGDQVQCYIAREQWRTSCLAESGRTDLGAKGDCKTGKKPVCRGDATTCYQLQLQFEQTCAATGGGEGDLDGAKEGFGDSIGEREIADETGLGKAPTTDDIKNQFGKEVDVAGYANKFDDRGFLNNHACMAPQKYTVSGISFTIDWSMLCLFLTYVGYFIVAVGYFIGFRIVSGGFD